jgi:hypothetical protein
VGALCSINSTVFTYFFLQQVFLDRHLGADLRFNLIKTVFNFDLIQFISFIRDHLFPNSIYENGNLIHTLYPTRVHYIIRGIQEGTLVRTLPV